MQKIAYVFPGQGSQSVGMMSAWNGDQDLVQRVYGDASDELGYDLWKVVSEGPESRINQTEVTQPAMLCAGVASWKIANRRQSIPAATMLAGHSLGEYTALVCGGCLDLKTAASLVAYRGRLMQSAVAEGDGAMAAIIGLSDERVRVACRQTTVGIVEAANFNAPGQVVIAGEKLAVAAAMDTARAFGAKRALLLPVSVPSHCSLMENAAAELADALAKTPLHMPSIPIVHNQSATIAGSIKEIREQLQMQLFHPVKWVDCILYMHQQGVTGLVEFGPGKVLTSLTRRIEKSLTAQAVYDAGSLSVASHSFGEE